LIEHMNAEVGRVLATLKELGLEQTKMVIFTSDKALVCADLSASVSSSE